MSSFTGTNAASKRARMSSLQFCSTLVVFVVFAHISLDSADAFANPSGKRTSLNRPRTFSLFEPSQHPGDIGNSPSNEFDPFATFTRPFLSAAAPLVLSASLLFAPPLLSPTVQAIESPNWINAATTSKVSPISTTIDIDLNGLPALTRKVIANRETLTKYFIESIKSFQPILDILSEGDTVTVTPPKDVKKAINALLRGEAEVVVNKVGLVDVRVESVPGVIVVRVINPSIPRLPFLKDGSAAIEFVDKIVDVAPGEINKAVAEFEKASEEVKAVENFLTWGAPKKEQITFSGSGLGKFLSSKYTVNGETVSLGALGGMTNGEATLAFLGFSIGAAYASSYAYYVQLREEAEQAAAEKQAVIQARKKAQAEAQAKKAAAEEAATKAAETKTSEPEALAAVDGYKIAAATSAVEQTEPEQSKPSKRKAFKKFFRRTRSDK